MTKQIEPFPSDRGFSKHLTKIIVVVMIVLMASSAFNLGGRGMRDAASSGVTVGVTRDGTRVSSIDRQYAAALLDTLGGVFIRLHDQQAPLATVCWGPDVVAAFKKNPEALWLVLQESRRDGPGASPLTLGPLDRDAQSTQDFGIFNSGLIWMDQLHPLPTSPLGSLAPQARVQSPISIVAMGNGVIPSPVTALPPLDQSKVFYALQDFLTIQSAASLSTAAVKVSMPAVDRFMAKNFQQFTMSVARVDANRFADQIGEPTDAQVAEQFARFASLQAGRVTNDDPFAFGYRVGDQVKLEWITLDREAVRAAVDAEKTPYQWEVDARIAYAKEPMAFASLAPTTRSSATTQSSGTTLSTTMASGFDAVKSGAIALQIARATDARLGEIERRIRSTLTTDYQAYSVARTTNAATQPATAVGVPIDSAGYLDALAADVGKRFKMTPPTVTHLTDAMRDREAIASASPSFAALSRPLPIDPRQLSMDLPTEAAPVYAIRTATAASTQPVAPLSESAGTLAVFQPSETVTDAAGSTSAIFRVTAAQASRPGNDLAAVRSRVVADWKATQAQSLALKSATASADAVRAGTLAVYNVPGAPAATVTVGPLAQSDAPPADLALTSQAFAQFTDAFGAALLGGDPAGMPVAALNVPVARRVYVTQRTGLRATWRTADELAGGRDRMRDQLGMMMARPNDPASNPFGLASYTIGDAWVNVDRIFERNGWTANHGS